MQDMPELREIPLEVPQFCPSLHKPRKNFGHNFAFDISTFGNDCSYFYVLFYFLIRPEQAPEEDMWKGALDSGKTGYFNHEDTATYLEIKSLASPGILRSKPKIVRRGGSWDISAV